MFPGTDDSNPHKPLSSTRKSTNKYSRGGNRIYTDAEPARKIVSSGFAHPAADKDYFTEVSRC
jgi:hypothetical protein